MSISKKNRSLVNIIGAPLTIFCIFYNQTSFTIYILFIVLLSFFEFFKLINNHSSFSILNVTIGFIWISSLTFFIQLYQEFNSEFILIIFLSIWITDSAAYIMGKNFGKAKILPSISPNKTWVGSLSGLFFTIMFLFYFYYQTLLGSYDFLPFSDFKFTHIDFILFSLIIGIFCQAGDFIESAFKRKLGVKDSSELLLGHGGFLDRFDSFYFVGIGLYLFLTFRNLI